MDSRHAQHHGHGPQVSVIIPAFNCARFVGQAIQSVLDQSYGDHEIIVVDDGSSDDTRAVARGFPEVAVVEGDHRGNAAARNRGAARARGEWLCFLDADDVWAPRKLELQLEHARASGADLCFPGARWFYEDGRTKALPTGPPDRQALWQYLVSYQPFGSSLSGVMMRRRCLEAVGGFDENLRLSVDWDLWIRLARRYAISWFDDTLVHVRLHDHNANRASDTRLRMYLACLRKHRRLFCDALGMRAAWHASYGSRLLRLGRHLLKSGRPHEAWPALLQSTRFGKRQDLPGKAALLLECGLRMHRLDMVFGVLQSTVARLRAWGSTLHVSHSELRVRET